MWGQGSSRGSSRVAERGLRRAPGTSPITAAILGSVIWAAAVEAADPAESAAGDERSANVIEASGMLPRFDALLDNLAARIEDIRAQADQMLKHADAATDSEGQMRFEEMYGKLVTAAETLEEERDRLRTMRDELAATGGEERP